MGDLHMRIDRWVPLQGVPHEIASTTGHLRIELGGECLTRMDDAWSQSVTPSVLVSLYPLALWFTSSWWRLGYESAPARRERSVDWRLAHELPAAGQGYLWPMVSFRSDGQRVVVASEATPSRTNETARYLSSVRGVVPLLHFQHVVSELVETVLERLRVTGCESGELDTEWEALRRERFSPELEDRRRIEAALGLDPEELDAAAWTRFERLAEVGGRRGAFEIAAARDDEEAPTAWLARIEREAGAEGPRTRELAIFADRVRAALARDPRVDPARAADERGIHAARAVRRVAGLGSAPLCNAEFGALLGLTAQVLEQETEMPARPSSLAVIEDGATRLLLRSRHPLARRFELARVLGDLVAAAFGEAWRPITDATTARQKMQRAFAAELLCPVDGLRELLGDDRSEDALLAACDAFAVSEQVMLRQLRCSQRTLFAS